MIGIVILNYNSWEDTKECILSIHGAEPDLSSYKIYVVDNASPISIPTNTKREWEIEDIHLIFNKKNQGYSAGNNVGIKKALDDGCDAVLICNSDVRFEHGSIHTMKRYLDDHTNVGIVGPKIVLADGSTQKECIMIKTGIKEKYLLRTRLYIFFPKLNRQYWGRNHDYDHDTFRTYAVLGCCFMISRSCAEIITPFDEHTFLYEEELIIGIRMEKSGFQTVYYPKGVIHHLHGQSTGDIRITPFPYSCWVASEVYYCRTYLHMKDWQIRPLWLYRTMIYAFRCLRYKEFRANFYNYWRMSWSA